MAPIGPDGVPVLLVAAVALFDRDGRVLIAQRPEGKAMAAMDLHTCARRMLGLREAIPVSDVDICAMVIEQPSLLAFEGNYKEVGPNETVVA